MLEKGLIYYIISTYYLVGHFKLYYTINPKITTYSYANTSIPSKKVR